MSALTDFLDEQKDVDLQLSRRTLAVSQEAWDGQARALVASGSAVGWHGSDVHRETGAVALVAPGGPLDDMVGEIIRVTRSEGLRRSVLLYVLDRLEGPFDISLTRRSFQQLGILANDSIRAKVEVLT